MTSNVVSIDRRQQARFMAAEIQRKQQAERSSRVVKAIRRNRMARLAATKKFWFAMTGLAIVFGAAAGAAGLRWYQSQTSNIAPAAVHHVNTPISAPVLAEVKPVIPPKIETVPPAVEKVVPADAPLAGNTVKPAPDVSRMPLGSPPVPNAAVVKVAPGPVPKPAAPAAAPHQQAKVVLQESAPVAKATVPLVTTQYEAPAAATKTQVAPAVVAPTPLATPATTQTASAAYQVVNVPVDGVLQIKIGRDPAIKHIKVGERLPSGEVLRKATADTGQVETSERSFKTGSTN